MEYTRRPRGSGPFDCQLILVAVRCHETAVLFGGGDGIVSIDLSGGLAEYREFVYGERPDDPEMRESVNA